MPPPPKTPPKPSPPQRTAAPQKTRESPAISMVVYGPTGTGKTSFAANFPRAGFIVDSQERGIYYLTSRGLVPDPVFIRELENSYKSWDKLVSSIYQASADDIDTLVVESLIGLQTICFLYHAKHRFSTNSHPDGDMTAEGFYAFQKGPKNAAQFDWPVLMEALTSVVKSGKNVIITGHSMDRQETSPTGTTYQKSMPVCDKEIWQRISRWAAIVAHMTCKVQLDEQRSKGLLKKVARPDADRLMYLDATAWCEAKNWYGLTGVIPCGESGKECFQRFMEALKG